MSQENVELFRKANDAWDRGDLEAYLELAHPDGKWYPGVTRVQGGVVTGHDELRGWWADVHATFEVLETAFDEVRDLGDTALGLGRIRGRSKSGVPIDTDYAVLARYRDGLIVWARAFASHAEALEAAGLSE